jgi:hypothetical protein
MTKRHIQIGATKVKGEEGPARRFSKADCEYRHSYAHPTSVPFGTSVTKVGIMAMG